MQVRGGGGGVAGGGVAPPQPALLQAPGGWGQGLRRAGEWRPEDPVQAQVENFTPVTDAMLQNPDPADWLNWRRTPDGWGHSPLNQINTENVHHLQLVWSW